MMRIKTLTYMMILFIAGYFLSLHAQNSTNIKTAIPISLEYPNPLYSMYFTSKKSFYATVYERAQEVVREFEFEDGRIKDKGLAVKDSGAAIGGQINGMPYLYLQHRGDVVPGYPDDSPFSFTSYSEEVFVAGYMENQLVIVNQNGNLNLCKAMWTGDRVKYEKISISDAKKDENGIFILGDSLYFSRIDKSGYYKLHQSVYNHEEDAWGEPIIMPAPYNIEGSNTLFYVWYEGVQYITSDRDGILTIYAIGDEKVKNPLWLSLVNNTKTNDTLSVDKTEDHRLKIKIRDKTYEEYVSANNYGFYNTIVSLTDEMHIIKDGDTIYILEIPKKDIREDKLSIVGRIKNKDGRDNLFIAENSKGEKFTLIPAEFAIENNLEVDKNLVKKENLSEGDALLLGGVEYAAYGHSVFDPNKITEELITDDADSGFNNINTRSPEELQIIKDLDDAIRTKREFTEDELLNIFGMTNDTCYVQVGFYKNRQPNQIFWKIFSDKYTVLPSDRMLEGRKVGTQYTIDLNFKDALVALNYTINGFKQNKITDKPFIRIGKWEEKYSIVKLVNGKYLIN